MTEPITPKTAPKKRKLTVALVRASLIRTFGNISSTAAAFGVERSSVQGYIKRHPELQPVLQDAREMMLDDGESSLHRAILAGEAWAVCFALKTIGKGRGYIEKTETEGSTVNLDLSVLTDEQLDAYEQHLDAGEKPERAYLLARKGRPAHTATAP